MSLLLPGQNAMNLHDIIACVFKQNLKSLMSFITKLHISCPGCIRLNGKSEDYLMHTFSFGQSKKRPDKIDIVILKEIPDPCTDQLLFDNANTNISHSPCGNLNRLSPCLTDEKCAKPFPKDFTNDTITNVDGYPIYLRRNTDTGGQLFTLNINNTVIDIEIRWVVPYSPLLSSY